MIYEVFRYFDIIFLVLIGILFPIYCCKRWSVDVKSD